MSRGVGAVSSLLSRINNDPIANRLKDDLAEQIEMVEPRQPSTAISPSSSVCKRQMFYKLNGVKPAPDDKDYAFLSMLENGQDRHERLQNHVAKLKDWEYVDVEKYVTENNLPLEFLGKIGTEYKLRDPHYNINFMLDGILLYKPTGKYYILEIKTEISFKHNTRKTVDPIHKHQALVYTQELRIPSVIFLYEDRNILHIKTYLYEPTEREIQMYYTKKLNDVHLAVEMNVVPPRLVAADISDTIVVNPDKICQYCGYKEQCENE